MKCKYCKRNNGNFSADIIFQDIILSGLCKECYMSFSTQIKKILYEMQKKAKNRVSDFSITLPLTMMSSILLKNYTGIAVNGSLYFGMFMIGLGAFIYYSVSLFRDHMEID